MAEFPALPLFTDAYMADTRHLTTAQHGAYLLLLMTAWRMPDCKLPDDDRLLARWCGLDYRNWCKMRPLIIDQFWKKDGSGKLQQNRLLDERKYADSVRRKNAEAGKASALKRKERHSTNVATETQPKSNPLPTPTPTSTPVAPKGAEFWAAYPKKVGRGAALKAYDRAVKKIPHEDLMGALKNHKFSTDPQYIPNPSTWLNQERWLDETTAKTNLRESIYAGVLI